ncbi:MAG TPA: alkaline phosphatase family protein, partial [Pyrinomonadaceae bacterium]|nr:alkaline phosphatase family protein [Pyrinomonadaceae bacterium]
NTAEFNNNGIGEACFDFKRLGVRVPMVMVSAHIAANTIVNTEMHHCSFLQTMQQKWGLTSLGPRQDTAPPFTEVFTATKRDHGTWPDWKIYPGPSSRLDETLMGTVDLGSAPLNDLQQSILDAIKKFYADDPVLSIMPLNTARDAKKFLEEAEKLRHRRPSI